MAKARCITLSLIITCSKNGLCYIVQFFSTTSILIFGVVSIENFNKNNKKSYNITNAVTYFAISLNQQLLPDDIV
ncbi:MAG: hypothetical protein A3F40_03770 [Chlamydiae bacterium RIFCSPHIGHO2_12_FULL_27_8]|nr:MAG: hypothetical protein A3F40_03770 [Chlamydiae bacterium RIFCSPHIGHO2_12_FULL_27_8]